MTTIAFFEIKDWEKEYLRSRLKKYKLLFFSEPCSIKNVGKAKQAEIISIFIYSKMSNEMLKELPKLKMITTRSTGFDHIDLQACKMKNIVVSNVPAYGENTVAEHTFALILSLSRNIHKSYVRTLKNDFSIDGLTGFDIKGKTLGIIGGGSIGMHVAKIAKGFGMEVLVFDVRKQPFLAEVIGFRYVALEELLKSADIVTLHVPLIKETFHLINKKNVKLMKKGAIIINTSRGAVVDTKALLYGLQNGILGGAGLDVIEGEEIIKEEKALLHAKKNQWTTKIRDLKIFERDNVVFTPHNAFNSKEALQRILDTTIENIESCCNAVSKNVVNG